MSSRLEMLEAKRRLLLHKCEEQRLELAYRFEQLKPREQLAAWSRRPARGRGQSPLAWLAGLAGLLFMLRRRRRRPPNPALLRGVSLPGIGWITGLVALASRATMILRILVQLRSVYRSLKATPPPPN